MSDGILPIMRFCDWFDSVSYLEIGLHCQSQAMMIDQQVVTLARLPENRAGFALIDKRMNFLGQVRSHWRGAGRLLIQSINVWPR